jgi:hypothetical protein
MSVGWEVGMGTAAFNLMVRKCYTETLCNKDLKGVSHADIWGKHIAFSFGFKCKVER